MTKFLNSGLGQGHITIEDRKLMKSQDAAKRLQAHSKARDKVKKLILGKGQMFGEDACLAQIFFKSDSIPKAPHYSVTCDSVSAEVLIARVEDVHKLFKNEK